MGDDALSSAGERGTTRLLAVVAHPDDESFGCGSLLAYAVSNGFTVTVCCATRGEAGEPTPGSIPEGRSIAAVREDELRKAAEILGIARVEILDFVDSGMTGPSPSGALVAARTSDVVAKVSGVIDTIRPDVVVTLDGSDGHRDHAAIRDATLAAVRTARWQTPATYLWCLPRHLMRQWADLLASQNPGSDYLALGELGTPLEDLTTVLDTAEYLSAREAAMAAHRSQVSPYEGLPPDLRTAFLCTDHLVRVRPAWTGGPVESSLLT
jgi:LmbE family N-acetylglucosaminyl deacetylase